MSSIKRNRYIDGKLLLAYPDDYTVLDIETTGLSPQNDYITEISAIKYRNNRRVDEFSSLVKPELSIPYYITRLTGINDAMVADAPAIDEVILSFVDFLADDIIAGYNVAFDLSFIAENLAGYYAKRMGLPVGRLVCASNKNNVLTDFFATGCYDARREFYKTDSPSMDILISSNLERLIYKIAGADAAKDVTLMQNLAAEGKYEITDEMKAQLADYFQVLFDADPTSVGGKVPDDGIYYEAK